VAAELTPEEWAELDAEATGSAHGGWISPEGSIHAGELMTVINEAVSATQVSGDPIRTRIAPLLAEGVDPIGAPTNQSREARWEWSPAQRCITPLEAPREGADGDGMP
jgi:hypothetical protein